VRRLLVLIAALLAVAGVAAAAGSKDPKKVLTKAGQAQARAINVHSGDLTGTGWKSSPATSNKGSTPKCSYYDPDQSDLTENGDLDSPTFSAPNGSEVSSSTGVFLSSAQASTAFKRVVQPDLPRCLAELLVKGGGGKIAVVSSKALAFPSYGSRSAAYRISATYKNGGTKVPVILDVVAATKGKVDVAVFFTAPLRAFSPKFEQRVVGRVVGRIA
jgi:hypothetical protein